MSEKVVPVISYEVIDISPSMFFYLLARSKRETDQPKPEAPSNG